MSIRLLIVGYSGRPFEQIYGTIDPDLVVHKRWCLSPADLLKEVRGAVEHNVALIDTLDLCSHSLGGGIVMEGGTLFSPDGTGHLIARSLRPFLTTDARVRLLSCDSASALGEGRNLLLMLRQAFGGSIVVYGTTEAVSVGQFTNKGFDQLQDDILYSSTEAETTPPRTAAARKAELVAFLERTRPAA
jgi:hypothetical protein